MRDPSVFYILKLFYKKIPTRRKKQIFILFLLIILSAFAETFSLASSFPFLQIITNQENVWDNIYLNKGLLLIGFEKGDNLITPICTLFAMSALISTIIKSYNLWFCNRIAALIGNDFSQSCFEQNLYQSYSQFLGKNSSDLIANNTLYINQATEILANVARLFSNLFIGFFIAFYLIFLNPFLAFIAILIFLFLYIILGKILQKKLSENSRIITKNSKYQVQLIQEAIGSFRDILLESNQKYFLKIYSDVDRLLRLKNSQNNFLNLVPRYLIEGLFLILISFLVFIMTNFESNFTNIIAVLGTFAIGGQKLLPCMQQTYGTWSYIVSSKSSLMNVIELSKKNYYSSTSEYNPKSFDLKKSIHLENISYKYPGSEIFVLNDFTLEIIKGQKIAIIGPTGSGKSTVVNLIMGLLDPTQGTIKIDGINIIGKKAVKRKLNWRKSIAHVPQNIFLKDGTIAENIAFAEDPRDIDKEKLIKAVKKAQLEDFILKQPFAYQSFVGENGVKLSGGQKQRIAIARALYKDQKVLILDEATSALDINTENGILKSILKLDRDMTIIIITHRKDSVLKCDQVIDLSSKLKL